MSEQTSGKLVPILRNSGKKEWRQTLRRASRYLAIRAVVVALTVLVGIYAAIWVSNLGGYADEQRRVELDYNVRMGLYMGAGSWLRTLSQEEQIAVVDEAVAAAFVAADLDKPFILRSFRYFRDAFTLRLGEARYLDDRHGSKMVLDILAEKLPFTLLIFGLANVITFFGGLFIASMLSRRYGTFVDRIVTLLIPLFAAPPWFHGIFLIVIFASFFKILPFGGIVGIPLPKTQIGYALDFLKHMILPVTACVLGALPMAIYTNRSLFLIHSTEDYVELAKAKGLSAHRLQKRYILKPVLPTIITNFILVAIVAWQGIILTESVFSWPGLGTLLIGAIRLHEVAVVIGVVTLFGYLLGVSVLILDLVYVLVDPRVSLSAGGAR